MTKKTRCNLLRDYSHHYRANIGGDDSGMGKTLRWTIYVHSPHTINYLANNY